MTILDWAINYYDRGWCVIPMNGKKAACKWKQYQTQRPDLGQVQEWFSNGQYKAIGVVLGEVSGWLGCRDFDVAEAYDRWAAEFPDLAIILPTVKTGKGYHVYFTCKLAKTRKFSDGELRGEKGLCVLPPSKHGNGKEYQWFIQLPKGPITTVDPEECGLIPQQELQKKTEEGGRTLTYTEAHLSNLKAISELIIIPEKEIEIAICATQPTGERQRNTQIFQFARALKGIPALANVNPKSLKPYVKEWHNRARHLIRDPFEDTWFDFLYGWGQVKVPMRLNLLEDAMKLGKQNCVIEPEYEQKPLRDLVALCRGLQAITGSEPFFLSARTAGRVLGVSHRTAWSWLKGIELDGWIKTEIKGNTQKATRFRYVGE